MSEKEYIYDMLYDNPERGNNGKGNVLGEFEIIKRLREETYSEMLIGKGDNGKLFLVIGYEVCGIGGGIRYEVHDIGLTISDVKPVVFCRDCLHYEMGACLKIYDDGAANKDAWQERKPDDFCSYGEDRDVPTYCGADMRPTSMSGANGEESNCDT